MALRWWTGFLDRSEATHRSASTFWQAVTGSSLSDSRGPTGQFTTLIPADGHAYLRLQRIDEGDGGVHLDLHVDEAPEGEPAARAQQLGASPISLQSGLAILASPGGLPFCLVRHHGEVERPRPVESPDPTGGWIRSLVDQVCIDIPHARYDTEVVFWSELTGLKRRAGALPEFEYLERPDGHPIRVLLQRLDDPADGRAHAHLDLAADDVEAEVRRHLRLGATVVHRHRFWTVLTDPSQVTYCVTARDPDTGRL